MYLARTGDRVVPTASFVATDTRAVLLEYLLATIAIVYVTMRASEARASPAA